MADGDITFLLQRLTAGEMEAGNELLRCVFADLRAMASAHMRGENDGHTLQPTSLVNEAYLKLFGNTTIDWKNRAHFFAVASLAMREVLVDYARRNQAAKRGAGAVHVPLDEALAIPENRLPALLDLDGLLIDLERINPRTAKVVVMRFFGDLTVEEIAEALGVSVRSVKRDWAFGRTWLYDQIVTGKNDEVSPRA